MPKLNVGIIGCGAISGIYTYNLHRLRNLKLVAFADLDPARAQARVDDVRARYVSEWKCPADMRMPIACSVDELLANPEIDIVLNLTVPKAHADVALRALKAGKHKYHEKPFGLSREEGHKILKAA